MNKKTPPPLGFWLVSYLALALNIFGLIVFFMQRYQPFGKVGNFTNASVDYFNKIPLWVTTSQTISLLSGIIGIVCLLSKKKRAILFLTTSLITILIHKIFVIFIRTGIPLSDKSLVLHLSVVVVFMFLVWFSRLSALKNWIK